MNTSKKRGAILALIGLVASGLAIGGSAAQADTAPARQVPMHDADAECVSSAAWYIYLSDVPSGVNVEEVVFDQSGAVITSWPDSSTIEVNYSGTSLSGYVKFSNRFKAYFSGSGDCTIVVPPPPAPEFRGMPVVCGDNGTWVIDAYDFGYVEYFDVEGGALLGTTTGGGPANFVVDGLPSVYVVQHFGNQSVGGTIMAPEGGCDVPVDLVSDGTAVLCGTELVVMIFASEGPLTFGVALIDRGNGDITSLGDPEFNENVATFTATIDPNEATAPVKYNVATEDGRHSEGFAEITIDENCESTDPETPEGWYSAECVDGERLVTNNHETEPIVVVFPAGFPSFEIMPGETANVFADTTATLFLGSTDEVAELSVVDCDVPTDPETPEQPETPETPEDPESPETPVDPESSETPVTIPRTSAPATTAPVGTLPSTL